MNIKNSNKYQPQQQQENQQEQYQEQKLQQYKQQQQQKCQQQFTNNELNQPQQLWCNINNCTEIFSTYKQLLKHIDVKHHNFNVKYHNFSIPGKIKIILIT